MAGNMTSSVNMYLNTVDNEGNQNSNHLVHKPVSTSVEKTASACMGAVLTMTLTNPLDVVKTRHQEKTTTGNRAYKGTRDAFSKILKSEGPFALWRGLAPGLMMALPSTAIYFVGYDYIRDQTSTRFSGTLIDSYSPLWAGGLARTISALVVSPLELLRTRMQSADGVHGFKGVMRGIKIMVEREGPKALWRGLIPTMMRDVPFSAVYWTGYERIKQDLSLYTNMTHFQISFASGASSGMIAAFITTPFDVIKTQRQVSTDIEEARLGTIIKSTMAKEGFIGFFRGVVPRIVKVAPACAIMISSYEMGKLFFSNRKKESNGCNRNRHRNTTLIN